MKKPCGEIRSANMAKYCCYPEVLPTNTVLLVIPYTTDKQLSRRKYLEDKPKHEPVQIPRAKETGTYKMDQQ